MKARATFASGFLLLLSVTASAENDVFIESLNEYGRLIEKSSKPGAIKYFSARKVTDSPMVAYQLVFRTSHPALLSLPDAEKDRTAYQGNRVKTEVWQEKFCSQKLKKLIEIFKVNLVSGNLQDRSGETQSMALCM